MKNNNSYQATPESNQGGLSITTPPLHSLGPDMATKSSSSNVLLTPSTASSDIDWTEMSSPATGIQSAQLDQLLRCQTETSTSLASITKILKTSFECQTSSTESYKTALADREITILVKEKQVSIKEGEVDDRDAAVKIREEAIGNIEGAVIKQAALSAELEKRSADLAIRTAAFEDKLDKDKENQKQRDLEFRRLANELGKNSDKSIETEKKLEASKKAQSTQEEALAIKEIELAGKEEDLQKRAFKLRRAEQDLESSFERVVQKQESLLEREKALLKQENEMKLGENDVSGRLTDLRTREAAHQHEGRRLSIRAERIQRDEQAVAEEITKLGKARDHLTQQRDLQATKGKALLEKEVSLSLREQNLQHQEQELPISRLTKDFRGLPSTEEKEAVRIMKAVISKFESGHRTATARTRARRASVVYDSDEDDELYAD